MVQQEDTEELVEPVVWRLNIITEHSSSSRGQLAENSETFRVIPTHTS